MTTPCGGPEELVRRSGGGGVLGGFDPEALAAAIRLLLGDEESLARMRGAGRVYVEREHSQAAFLERLGAALAEKT